MFRLFDYECIDCGYSHERMVDVPFGNKPENIVLLYCHVCKKSTNHRKLLSLFAEYLGEKPLSPRMSGGQFDTMGNKKLPSLPEFKGQTAQDFEAHVNDKSYKEIKKERAARKLENMRKRQRAKALEKDPNLSFRHNPLPGDPKFN